MKRLESQINPDRAKTGTEKLKIQTRGVCVFESFIKSEMGFFHYIPQAIRFGNTGVSREHGRNKRGFNYPVIFNNGKN